jgi:hypothetical protein
MKRKPTTFKNPRANGILEHVHQVLGQMLRTALIQLPPMTAMSFWTMRHGPSALPITWYSKPPQVQPFLDETCSSTFRSWLTGNKIGERRQSLTDRGNQHKNAKLIDYNYKVGNKVLVINEGIFHKAESAYGKEPWTISTVHTNGTIRIQRGTKTEGFSIRRVEPFTDDIL